MTPLHLSAAFVERLGWVLVHSIWQFALLVLAALVLQRAMQRASAAARYCVLLLALGAMLAATLATWLAIPHEGAVAEVSAASNESAARPGQADVAGTTESDRNSTPRLPITTRPLVQAPAAATPLENAHAVVPMPAAATPSLAAWCLWIEQRLRPWLNSLVIAWCVGVFLFALRPILSWYRVRRLRTVGVSAVPDAVQQMLERTAQRLGLRHAVRVLQSTLVQTAVVVGYFRPVILLPVSVITGLSPAQLEAILAHELAHIRRHDYLVNLLQTLVETAFFYHPAVWWLSNQIRSERENCCDDIAVAVLGNRVEYGRALLALEEYRGAETALTVGARGGSLLIRVRRLLGHVPPGRAFSGGSIAGLGLLAAATIALGIWAASGPVASSASNGTPSDLRAEKAEDKTGDGEWVPLFNGKDLTGWFVEGENPGTWRVERGELLVDSHALPVRGQGIHGATTAPRYNFLLTEKTYSEFVLRFEYQLSQGASSGVALWAMPYEKVYREGPIHPEIKLLDDPSYPKVGWPTGTFFWNLDGGGHLLPPDRRAKLKAVESWNQVEVEALAQSLRVSVNGVAMLSARPDKLADEKGAFAGLKRCSGHLGFEKGTGVARFRNIAIKELKLATGPQEEKQPPALALQQKPAEPLLRVPLPDRTMMTITLSAKGKLLAVAPHNKTTVQLWDVATGKAHTLKGNPFSVTAMAFSPDGKTLATGTGSWLPDGAPGEIKLWDVATGKERATLGRLPETILALAFSPDGKTLASASKTVKLWDAASGKETGELKPNDGFCWSVAFAPEGKRLAVGVGVREDNTPGAAILYDLGTRKARATLGGHKGAVGCVAFAPDGKALASADSRGTLKLWDVATAKERTSKRPPDGTSGSFFLQSLAFAADSKTVVSTMLLAWPREERSALVLKEWDATDGQERTIYQATDKDAPKGFPAVLAGDASVVGLASPTLEPPLVGPEGKLELWELRSLAMQAPKKVKDRQPQEQK